MELTVHACLLDEQDNSSMPKAGVDELGPRGGGFIVGMYVAPEARDRGVARALLEALEDAARGPIHNFNGNPVARFFGEKSLV